MTKKTTKELIEYWREIGPVEWAEGVHGWIGIDGQPIKLHDWQRAILTTWWNNRDTTTTLAVSNIKKTGKTFVNAVLLAWRWLTLPGVHFAVANDLDQSMARQFTEIADMVRRNPFLRENVNILAKSLEFIPTQSVLQALAGDAAGNAGANQLSVSHTETWGIIYEQDIRNYEELTPPPGKNYGLPALRIADSYAGFLEESNTWHDLVDRGLEGDKLSGEWPIYQDGGLLLFHMTGSEAQARCFRGTKGEAKIYYRDQRASLRENSYKRLHENQRMVNIGTFIDQDSWEALIDPNHHPLAEGSRALVYVGLDLAVAAGGDNCALIGTYFDEGKVKIAFHKVWRGGVFRRHKLSLMDDIEPYLLDLAKRYNLAGIFIDPWQGIHLAEGLRTHGLNVREISQTHTTRGPKDTTLFELASNGQLVLYDDHELRHAAAGANAKELGNGQIFLQKSGGRSKIDLLVALSNCADECNAIGQGYRGISSIPNIFYDYSKPDGSMGNLDDFLHAGDHWELAPGRNKRGHPPGVTSANCPHRNRGCDACVDELRKSGYYDRLEREALDLQSQVHMSEEDARQQFLDISGLSHTHKQNLELEAKEQNTRRYIHKAINIRKKENHKKGE